jgi:hypothetical protein
MFGSVTLDIVIGLVFVYLLYSLLATIIAELIVSWLGVRARMLRQAIERMLVDRYYEDTGRKWYQKLLHPFAIFFLYEFREFKTGMAGRFYRQPSIKYLAKGKTSYWGIFSSSKPSYLRPDNFSETLIQMLKSKGAGDTDMQKIGFCLKFNTLQIQPNSLKQITGIFADAAGDPDKFKEKLNQWYNEMMERLSGWFKRKIQFILFVIGLIMAITFNVDSINIAKKLAKDKNAREQLVQMAISASDSNSAIAKALAQSNDSTLNDSLLQEGYRQVKQASEDAGMVLGLGWNLEKLSKIYAREIPNTRVVTCWNYATVVTPCGVHPKSWKSDSMRMARLNNCLTDSVLQVIRSARILLKKEKNDSLRGRYATTIRDKTIFLEKFTSSLNYFGNKHFTQIDRIVAKDRQHSVLEGRRNYFAIEKICYVLHQTFANWLVLLGFIITALAISLGSNFWFDLLSKLVAMRSSGVKPTDKQAADTPEPAQLPDFETNVKTAVITGVPHVPDPPDDLISSVVNSLSEELIKIAGVRSVFKGRILQKGKTIPCIRVNVTDKITKDLVESRITEIPGRIDEIPINIVISGQPRSHNAIHIGQISNKSRMNGTGSIGCIVQHQGTGRTHILSCWHVMKGDLNYDTDDPHTMIIDHDQHDLAIRWAGGIDQSYDFAFARCIPGKTCDNEFLRSVLELGTFNFRQVTDTDINGQAAVKYYDSINGLVRTGRIYSWCPAMIIKYPDKSRYIKDILVLTDDESGEEHTISQSGNSGSLVFDEDGSALGMIIAGDNLYSYAVKLSNIFNLFPEMKIL